MIDPGASDNGASEAKKQLTGLALGSGAARGLTHIGVLLALEKRKVDIDLLAGTSIGALIGALYASGVPVKKLQQVACELNWRKLAGLVGPSLKSSGLLDSRKISRFIDELLPVKSFDELRLPFAVTATDIESGELIVIRQGQLLPAILAAIAFPGLFAPVRIGDRFLVDGGLCAPVPTDILRQMGADRVIGVCAIPTVAKRYDETFAPRETAKRADRSLLKRFTPDWVERTFSDIWTAQAHSVEADQRNESKRQPPGLLRVFAQSVAILENQINALRLDLEPVDLLIRPDLEQITLLEFHKAAAAIAAGQIATETLLDRIAKVDCGQHSL